MKVRRLALRKDQPKSHLRRIVEGTLSILGLGVMVFYVVDLSLSLRERGAWRAATQREPNANITRQVEAIRFEIGLLLRPRDGAAGIGGDPSARLMRAAALYGRLAELEEGRGNEHRAREALAKGVALLREARDPKPTEETLRRMTSTLTRGQSSDR